MRRWTGLIAAILIGFLLPSIPADAATVIVVTKTTDDTQNGCTPSDCSLREAIFESNSTSTVETIKLGPSTYALDDFPGANEDFAVTGDLDVRRPVIIKGSVLSTAIEQGTADRVFDVIDGGAVTLDGVVVTGGSALNSSGGGIRVNPGASATLDLSIVYDNDATIEGGGIYNLGSLTVKDSRVTDNVVAPAGNGGGISNLGKAVLKGAEIENNTAGTAGGGMAIQGSKTTKIVDSTIAGNATGTHEGGGIAAFNSPIPSDTSKPTINLMRTTVSNNTTNTSGGGLYLAFNDTGAPAHTRVLIEDSTISGNSGKANGGGVYFFSDVGALAVTQTTVYANTADSDGTTTARSGGGIHKQGTGPVKVSASILAGNIDPNISNLPDCTSNNIDTLGSNVVGSGCFAAPIATDAVGGLVDFLEPLQFNGGRTKTHALEESSTAQDRHSGAGCSGTDQRGVPRPTGGACDSGSYEYAECGNVPISIVGSSKSETIDGTSGNDSVLALGGDDKVFGKAGNDSLCGGDGNDVLKGEVGDDSLFGEAGDDVMDGGPDADTCVGGSGTNQKTDC